MPWKASWLPRCSKLRSCARDFDSDLRSQLLPVQCKNSAWLKFQDNERKQKWWIWREYWRQAIAELPDVTVGPVSPSVRFLAYRYRTRSTGRQETDDEWWRWSDVSTPCCVCLHTCLCLSRIGRASRLLMEIMNFRCHIITRALKTH